MTISSVTSSYDTVSATTSTDTSNSTITQEDYMILLATELQYQDPTEPMDTNQLVEQTCNFSQLDALQSLDEKMSELLAAQQSQVNPASYLGQQVTVEGNAVSLESGETSDLTITLEDDAASVIIDIYDANGNVVAMQNLGAAGAGDINFSWDGSTLDGGTAPDGNYTIGVRATDVNGADVSASTTVTDTVVSVSNNANGTELTLSNGTVVNYTDVLSISLAEEEV